MIKIAKKIRMSICLICKEKYEKQLTNYKLFSTELLCENCKKEIRKGKYGVRMIKWLEKYSEEKQKKEIKQMKLIRRDPRMIFFLYIGGLLLAILYFIVKNFILRYVFLVFILCFFSGLFFYDVFKIMEKKDLGIYLLLALLCGLFMPWIFPLIHELYHAFTAIILGYDVIKIEIYYPYGGLTTFSFNIITKKSFWIPLSGSLGSLLITLILNKGVYHTKRIKFSIFFPLFMITSWWILHEVSSWIIGVDTYIKGLYDIEHKGVHDAVRFLYLYIQFDSLPQIDPVFLKGILIFAFIVILVWFVFNLIKRIMREKTNKS